MLAFGALNAFGFLLIGETCAATNQASYVGAWRETVGTRSSFVPALASLLLCFLAAVACAEAAAEIGADILTSVLHVAPTGISRVEVLLAISAVDCNSLHPKLSVGVSIIFISLPDPFGVYGSHSVFTRMK